MSELTYTSNQEMNMRDYLRVLFRQKAVLFISILIIVAIAFIGLKLKTPIYEASVKMLVSGEKQVNAPYYKELLSSHQMQASLTQSEIVTSDPILQRVVDALHLYQKPFDYEKRFASPLKRKLIAFQKKAYEVEMQNLRPVEQRMMNYRRAVEELRKSIKVEPVKDTNIFVIKVRDYDRLGAVIVANVLSRSYVIFDLEQQLAELQLKYGAKHPVVMQLQDNIKQMKDNLSGKPLENTEAIGPASVKIIEQASIPLKPLGQSKLLLLAAAFILSIFLGITLAFIFEYLDQTIKSPKDVESALVVPFFGALPPYKGRKDMIVKGKWNKRIPRRFSNACCQLADQIHLMMNNESFKSILIVSPEKTDGAGLITASLGYQLAEHSGKNVLLIDANYRHPALHKIFNLEIAEGLVDVLTGKVEFAKAVQTIRQGLSVVPAGQCKINPVVLLDSPKTKEILEKVKDEYDVILVTSSELMSHKDACILASLVDKTLFLVSENETRRQVASSAVASLKERKVSFMGAILNKRTFPIPSFIYNRI